MSSFEPHADMLRQVELMTQITEHGPPYLCFTPDGFPEGYATLSEHASVIEIGAVDVSVASLEDVVASKQAAGRPKDIVALPPLEAPRRHLSRNPLPPKQAPSTSAPESTHSPPRSARRALTTRNDRV